MAKKTLTHQQFDEDNEYRTMLAKKEFTDLKLCTPNNPIPIVGHRAILGAVSTTLKNLMKKSPNLDDPIVLKNPVYENKVDGRSMIYKIVEFIYEGKITIPEEKYEDFSDCYRMLNISLGGSIDKIKEEEDDEDETIAPAPMTMIKKEAFTNEDLQKPIISSCTEDDTQNPGIRFPDYIEAAVSSHLNHSQPQWHQPLPVQNEAQHLQHSMHLPPPTPPHQEQPTSKYFWIKVENVKTELQKDHVKSNFSKQKSIDFRVDLEHPDMCYVAFKTETDADIARKIMKAVMKQYNYEMIFSENLPDFIQDNKQALKQIKERFRPPLPTSDAKAASKPPLPLLLQEGEGWKRILDKQAQPNNILSPKLNNPGKRGQESMSSELETIKKPRHSVEDDNKIDIFLPVEHKEKIAKMLHYFLPHRLKSGQISSKTIYKVLIRELTHRVLVEKGHTIAMKEVEGIVNSIFVMNKSISDEEQAKRAIRSIKM